MNEGAFILINGAFQLTADKHLSLAEFDGFLLSEKIRAVRTIFPFFEPTLALIKLELELFGKAFPELTDHGGAGLKRQLERTLTKNKQFMGSVLTIRFWAVGTQMNYSISCMKTDEPDFGLNSKGLYLDLFNGIEKMYSSLSHFPIGSGLYWEIAAHHPKSVNIDQYVLSNADQQIVEAIGSNLYVIKNGFIKGASIQQGAYSDLTKPILLSIFKSLKFIYNETDGIILKDMQEAEEVFLCDALHGIRWAAGFESKRYFNQNIRKISEMFLKNI